MDPNNINPTVEESMKELSIKIGELIQPFKRLMEEFVKSAEVLADASKIIIGAQEEFINEPTKHKKGKKLKCWDNKRFYQ